MSWEGEADAIPRLTVRVDSKNLLGGDMEWGSKGGEQMHVGMGKDTMTKLFTWRGNMKF